GRWISVLRWVRKGLVLVLEASVVLVGLVMLVTPGPAFLVIPAGLAILATEFYWARRLLLRLRARASRALQGQSTTIQPPNPQPLGPQTQIVPPPASSRVSAAASLPVPAPVPAQGANPAKSATGDVPQRAGGA
ncbi:MAG: PGPGW domain-containing protein, partial [Planctomycetaceae bacterium]